MHISKQQWHTRVYLWWYEHKYYVTRNSTNLCPYVRAVVFWAPIRAFFWNWITLTTVRGFKITLNMFTVPMFLVTIPLLLGSFAPLVAGVIWWAYAFMVVSTALALTMREVAHRLPVPEFDEKKLERRRARKRRYANFRDLISGYFRAGHDRVCPEVNITD